MALTHEKSSNSIRRKPSGNQKDLLATHAKQLQYLNTLSRSESDRETNYIDIASLPGVKVPYVLKSEAVPRKTMRNSIRRLPGKSSSAKDKKKDADKLKEMEKDNEKKEHSSSAENIRSSEAKFNEKLCDEEINESKKVKVTQLDEPLMSSLSLSELMLATADKGDLGTMQVLLKKRKENDVNIFETRDMNGETPLHKVAKHGYLKCLMFLAEQIPDYISSTDNSRMTPAAHAAKNGHVNCLKWLVEETKAYVELAVQDGQTHLLHYSAAEGVEQCLNYLLTFMKKRKITTDIIDGYGQSPLHTASKMGHLACVQTLVEHGSDVLAKDNEGLTSANIAYINKHSLCSRYLLMAESTWILASRVATLFREVNVVKKENKELKKSLENMKARKKSFPKDLPHRPETVGAHVDESGKQIEESSLSHVMSNLRERNFPDGESPKNTFTEADKRRPQHVIPGSRVISKDGEISDKKNFKVIRQSSNSSDSIPFVSIYGIAELNPSEKVKAKEIAMVTHQLLSTRHLQLVKKKKNQDVNPAKDVDPVIAEHKSTTTSVDDSAVVMRRVTLRNKSNRPKSLCDKDLKFMRSASDIGFSRNVTSFGPLERTISCTEISTQSKFTEDVEKNSSSDLELSKNDSDGKIWENVGARKLLSRKKNSKPRPLSAGLTDLQTVSTDKILELYARESRGSSSRLNTLIKEEDENSMGLRTISSLELKSSYSLEESNKPPDVEALNNIEKNKGSVSNTTNSTNVNTETKVKKRPVAKPRQKRPVSSNQTKNSIQTSKDNVHFDSYGFNAKLDETNIGFTDV